MSAQQADKSSRDAARDAFVSSLIVYGMQAVFLVGVTAVLSRRWMLEHARWRYEQWRKRGEREWNAARAEVQRDISRLEHGDEMPAGGPPEHGLYGDL
jgi:hypothetical protein